MRESCPQLINVRANPLYQLFQLFQPLKSLILKTLSFSSSLAQSESISVAMQTLQLPLKAASPRLLQTERVHCLVALFLPPAVCRLSAFYKWGWKQQSPFMPGFKLHVVYQIFIHVSLSPNANVPFMKLDSGAVFLHIIWNSTTVPLFDRRKWTSGIFFPKWIRDLICDCKYSPIRALLSCSKMEMAPNPGTLKSTEICCVSK